mmetsp:Transcript_77273/g.125385  ORF Transcript_77273/g.125385 Transcript_77273/m.125385 type:complete len:145 (-) Transcript_77273:351-785(-)
MRLDKPRAHGDGCYIIDENALTLQRFYCLETLGRNHLCSTVTLPPLTRSFTLCLPPSPSPSPCYTIGLPMANWCMRYMAFKTSPARAIRWPMRAACATSLRPKPSSLSFTGDTFGNDMEDAVWALAKLALTKSQLTSTSRKSTM